MKSPAEIIADAMWKHDRTEARLPIGDGLVEQSTVVIAAYADATDSVIKTLAEAGYRIVPALTDETRQLATETAAHLWRDADFYRSWTDGRRRLGTSDEAGYVARCLELAEERDRWAAAIEALLDAAPDAGGGNG